ncbi:chemotaxis protein CheW [Carboxylicivirga sp. M1479]|uniref:chemotaxis protein CheW n=1 Tax=Carboxylicivirga sp. M1479 TaxID=2594476 RepID=UPI001177A27C|nr:chemotaxis protein CheW [Carboxylicivirga sp. M1479]TRX72063.1 chemotaxis protein CheW [Carboxylicivirga sp. M1479]
MKNNLLQSFLSFHLKNESFALGVNRVLEIIEVSDEQSITYLPKSPETIEGVVNFRGQVIPVVNMRLKFDMEAHTTSDKYVIMVLNLNINGTEQVIGAMADKVVDVLEIAEEDIQDVPEVGQGINSEFIQGLVHRDKQFIMLLDIEKAINSEEIIQLKDSLEEEEETIPNQIHV